MKESEITSTLGKEKKIISQEEIEIAWQKYTCGLGTPEAKLAFKAGVNFALGKQEKDAKSMQLSDIKSKIDEWMKNHTEEEVYEILKNYDAIENPDTITIDKEENMMVSRSKVQKLYRKLTKDGSNICLYAAATLDALFGSKCLPDEICDVNSNSTTHTN